MVNWGTGVGPVTSRGKEKGNVVTLLLSLKSLNARFVLKGDEFT